MSTSPNDLDIHYNQPTPSTGHGQSSTGNSAQGHTNYGSSSPQHVVRKHGAPSTGTTSDNRAEQRPYSSAASKSTQGSPRPASGQTTPMNFRNGEAESKPGASTPQQSRQHSFAAAGHRQSEQAPPSPGRQQVTQQAPGYHDYDRGTLTAQEPYKYPPKLNTPGRVSPPSPKSGRRSPPSPAASGRVPWKSLGYRSRSPKTSVLSPSRPAAQAGTFNKGRNSPITRQPATKPDQRKASAAGGSPSPGNTSPLWKYISRGSRSPASVGTPEGTMGSPNASPRRLRAADKHVQGTDSPLSRAMLRMRESTPEKRRAKKKLLQKYGYALLFTFSIVVFLIAMFVFLFIFFPDSVYPILKNVEALLEQTTTRKTV
ncbi:hypothetical protein MTO96_042994 [Rhipicephalus appendiculatus]